MSVLNKSQTHEMQKLIENDTSGGIRADPCTYQQYAKDERKRDIILTVSEW